MKTNEIKIIGRLENLSDPLDLLLEDSEVQQFDFAIHADCGLVLSANARTDVGSAFHALATDARFQEGARVMATGYLIGDPVTLIAEALAVETSHDSLQIEQVDLQPLLAKAQQNFALKKAELFQLLEAYDAGTPQHYAVAVQLRRAHRDRSEATAIAEKVCRCSECRKVFSLDSPRFTFNFGKVHCNSCMQNVGFDLVDPLPSEPHEPEEKMTFEEIQKRLDDKFGRGR